MNAFEYASPTSISEAVTALAGKPGAAPLGGGTDLLNRMKEGIAHPDRIVATRSIQELSGVQAPEGTAPFVVRGATTLAALLESEAVKKRFPGLWQATLEVGTPQIRNMATVAGNLLQRPRDWYFRNGFGLLGHNEGEIVRKGDNRYAAIYQTDGNALYVNTSSLAPPLIALGAKATLTGPAGSRTIPVADLYRVPRKADELELTIQPGEILTSVEWAGGAVANASYEVRHKQAHDWPLVLASVALNRDGETVRSGRIVLGSVAPIPWVSEPALAAIVGKSITPETAEAAGNAAAAAAKPLSMNAYKVKLVAAAVKRALLAAVGNRYWEA